MIFFVMILASYVLLWFNIVPHVVIMYGLREINFDLTCLRLRLCCYSLRLVYSKRMFAIILRKHAYAPCNNF